MHSYQKKVKKDLEKYCKNFCESCKFVDNECELSRYVPDRYLVGFYCKKKTEVKK
jgi:hypothetical protein